MLSVLEAPTLCWRKRCQQRCGLCRRFLSAGFCRIGVRVGLRVVVVEFTDSEGTVLESMFERLWVRPWCPREQRHLLAGPTFCYVSGPTPASSGCVVGSDRHTSEAAAEAVAFGGMRQSAGAADSLARARSTTALLGSRSRGGEGHASRVCCLEGAFF